MVCDCGISWSHLLGLGHLRMFPIDRHVKKIPPFYMVTSNVFGTNTFFKKTFGFKDENFEGFFCKTFQIFKTIEQSKKEGKDQESIQSSTTPDPGYQWESNNFTIRHHKREPRGQLFPSQ